MRRGPAAGHVWRAGVDRRRQPVPRPQGASGEGRAGGCARGGQGEAAGEHEHAGATIWRLAGRQHLVVTGLLPAAVDQQEMKREL